MFRLRSLLGVAAVLATCGVVWMLEPASRSAAAVEGQPGRSPITVAHPAAVGDNARATVPAGMANYGTPLYRFVEPAEAAELNAAMPAPAREIRYVQIDRGLIESKDSPFWRPAGEGRVTLTLPNGESLRVVIDASQMLGANRFSSSGHVEGAPESQALFAYNDGFLSASIETNSRSYVLRPATQDATQFYEIDPALIPECGGVRHPEVSPAAVAAAAARKSGLSQAGAGVVEAPEAAGAASGDAPEVHLLMLYTPTVMTTMTGAARVAALQSEFDMMAARVNTTLSRSQVAASVKLIQIAETNYNEAASAPDKVQDDALTALQSTTDGKMDEVHALRDQIGADLVCLALGRADSASIGLAYVLDSPSREDEGSGLMNPAFAFGIVQYAAISGTNVVAHELGHLFGCAHARGDSGTTGNGDGAYSYSYGYRFQGTDGRVYRDVMAYSPGTQLSYYSNPRLVVPDPVNVAAGVAAGQPGEADCALTIQQNAFEVATYRLQTQAAPAGALVNVSTRAHVGTGDQVLIAGFIVDGAQSKRVLVRAAGPALAAYGVTNQLAQPVLHVHGGDSELARNSGWSTQPGTGDIALAAAQVGAFAFQVGSGDSALLLDLSPGSYSAVVEGAAGSAGSALVEVYDVDRTGNRIINLSTRGYADKGREMFGGFVVQGDVGTTKRILIRVLGPTLERSFGVTGAMEDPMLALHSGEGDLLIKNDDWSSQTTSGVVGPTADFSPAAVTYTQQQIAATGFAPANRREPCVMLDLPPGNYTVVAQPFERLGGTFPEEARPGVGIIEVYEIAP